MTSIDRHGVETCLWATTAVLALAIAQMGPATITPAMNGVMAALSLVFGARSFLGHGGPRITTLGLFNLACAMFVGYSGLFWTTQPPALVSQHYLMVAIFCCLATQVATTGLAWRHAANGQQPRLRCATSEDASGIVWTGLVVLLAGLALLLSGVATVESVPLNGAAFAAVVLVSVGTVLGPDYRVLSLRSLWLVGGLAIYTVFFHTGNGRLQIVALACSMAMLVSARLGTRWLKAGLLTGMPLAIAWLAWYRIDLIEARHPGYGEGRTGLESMTSGLQLLTRLIESQRTTGEPMGWGVTFVTAPLNLLPDWLVTAAPEALGYRLVRFAEPERAGTGYSVVALTFGEWLYNFSFPGLLLMIPVTAWALVLLDNRLASAVRHSARGRTGLVTVAVFVVLAATIGDLVWGGVHTYLMRVLSRLPVLLLVLLVVARPVARPVIRGREPPPG